MNKIYDIIVNCSVGIDSIDDRNEIPYKTTDSAIDDAQNGSSILVYPGTYSGIDIETQNLNPFEYNITGYGKNTFFNSVIHKGFVNSVYKSISLHDIEIYTVSECTLKFDNVYFIGGHKMILKMINNINVSQLNEITFCDCEFGINFQIIIKSGIYKITFKNCTFKSKVIPIIYSYYGEIELYITTCNLEVPIIENKKSIVYIYHSSSIFKNEIWGGKECSVFSMNEQQTLSNLKSQKTYHSELSNRKLSQILSSNNKVVSDIYKAIQIDSSEFNIIKLKNETEFVHILGIIPVTIILPEEKSISNGHYIQILNEGSIAIINGLQYTDRVINIRYLFNRGWIFYK